MCRTTRCLWQLGAPAALPGTVATPAGGSLEQGARPLHATQSLVGRAGAGRWQPAARARGAGQGASTRAPARAGQLRRAQVAVVPMHISGGAPRLRWSHAPVACIVACSRARLDAHALALPSARPAPLFAQGKQQSTADLENAIRAKEHEMQHASLTIQQEKVHLKQIKQMKDEKKALDAWEKEMEELRSKRSQIQESIRQARPHRVPMRRPLLHHSEPRQRLRLRLLGRSGQAESGRSHASGSGRRGPGAGVCGGTTGERAAGARAHGAVAGGGGAAAAAAARERGGGARRRL